MAQHTFLCIDGHTCGNPVRVVSGGGPQLEGTTMLEGPYPASGTYVIERHKI